MAAIPATLSYGTSPTIAYDKAWDLKEESLRKSVARGVNLPDGLRIKQTSFVDPSTKVNGLRTTVQFERTIIDAGLNVLTPRIYLVAEIPGTVAQADIDKLVEVTRAGVADTTNALITLAIAGMK